LTKALTIVKGSFGASGVGSFWHVGSSPLEISTTSDYKKGKSNQVKIYMFRGSNYKKGDLNLADNQSFLSGGRWPRFLPNFSDNHLPHLDLGLGGQQYQRIISAWGSAFTVLGWIPKLKRHTCMDFGSRRGGAIKREMVSE
jgi:hypothetical protein